jgi:nicotinate-nucleotide pyrophosphorylase (carboxylating)
MLQEKFIPDLTILKPFIKSAFEEDLGDGDHTSLATISTEVEGKAKLLVKDHGIIAGLELAEILFNYVDPNLKVINSIKDGSEVEKGNIAFLVEGKVHSILRAERVVLNSMQRMSGIATLTHSVVESLKGTHTKVLDTRKTTPGFRYLEKWAVKIGGGENHRFGLYDMILIKDNHVDFAGGISKALHKVYEYLKKTNKILSVEIEVRNYTELQQVLDIGGIDRILLDNFTPETLYKAISMVNGKFKTEASGNINPDNALEYAKSGVDYISMGALTHSYKNFDLSLKAL